MPQAFLYLAIMLVIVCVWLIVLKRPIHEAILLSFGVLVVVARIQTGSWPNVWSHLKTAFSTSLIYSMIAFIALSQLLVKTKVIDSCVAVILSLFGRIPGGAGYVSLIASSFMGALSGSGPGNVMATGTITIPAMKRTGFPAHLAANIESTSSYLGNMIPPSSNIVAAMGAYLAFAPNSDLTQGQFWLILWGIALWFILQRLLTIMAFCAYYKVKPMKKEELPSLKESLKKGWKGLFLPVVILVPFILDYVFKSTFFTERLGATGAKYLSSSILMFTAGIAGLFTVLIAPDKSKVTPHAMARTFADGLKGMAPMIVTCIFGYMIGALFTELDVTPELLAFIDGLKFSKFGMVLFVCVFTCFLGMVIPGSSLVVVFGPAFITMLASVGVDPLLAAAMLPCICGVMCGITPPLALGMYAGMTIAQSDFGKTVKNDLWWVAAQFLMEVIVLMGWLPILGL